MSIQVDIETGLYYDVSEVYAPLKVQAVVPVTGYAPEQYAYLEQSAANLAALSAGTYLYEPPTPLLATPPTIERTPVDIIKQALGLEPLTSSVTGLPIEELTMAVAGGGAGTIAGVIAALTPYLKTGTLAVLASVAGKAVMAWVKKNWQKLAIAGVTAAALAGIVTLWLNKGGKSKDAPSVAGIRRPRRRYSIGANPRIGTLLKVSKRCDRLTHNMYNRFRHAGLLRTPVRHAYALAPYHPRRRK